MVPWESLGEASRNADRFQAAVLLKNWLTQGGKGVRPKDIHEARRLWELLHETNHWHASKIYEEAHNSDGEREHGIQAKTVNVLLERWNSRPRNVV